jgi:hypothetical protein
MVDLYACESKRTLIQLLTVNKHNAPRPSVVPGRRAKDAAGLVCRFSNMTAKAPSRPQLVMLTFVPS